MGWLLKGNNPNVSAIEPRGLQGHFILKLQVRLKPAVINCPQDLKHETIPSNIFMPGKGGNVPKDVSPLYSLVRLLHRQRNGISQHLPSWNGFVAATFSYNNDEDALKDYSIKPVQLCSTHLHNAFSKPSGNEAFPVESNVENRGDTGGLSPSPHQDTHGEERICETTHLPDVDVPTDVESQSGLVGDQRNGQIDNCQCLLSNAYLSIAATFWSWWRSQPGKSNPTSSFPYLKARKFLHSADSWINLLVEVVNDLILHSKGAVIQSVESLARVHGSIAISRLHIQEMFAVIDDYVGGIPYLPCDPVDSQARGIGNMVAFWERMRNICPKINTYNGLIFNNDGTQCRTSRDLDSAMLATRTFWFEAPVEWDEQ